MSKFACHPKLEQISGLLINTSKQCKKNLQEKRGLLDENSFKFLTCDKPFDFLNNNSTDNYVQVLISLSILVNLSIYRVALEKQFFYKIIRFSGIFGESHLSTHSLI